MFYSYVVFHHVHHRTYLSVRDDDSDRNGIVHFRSVGRQGLVFVRNALFQEEGKEKKLRTEAVCYGTYFLYPLVELSQHILDLADRLVFLWLMYFFVNMLIFYDDRGVKLIGAFHVILYVNRLITWFLECGFNLFPRFGKGTGVRFSPHFLVSSTCYF